MEEIGKGEKLKKRSKEVEFLRNGSYLESILRTKASSVAKESKKSGGDH